MVFGRILYVYKPIKVQIMKNNKTWTLNLILNVEIKNNL